MLKILLASSQVLLYQAVDHLLHEYDEEIKLEHVENGEDILARNSNDFFDLIIIDMNLEGLAGLNLFRKLQEQSFSNKILVISLLPDESLLNEMIALGINGFLCQTAEAKEYVQAIKNMLEKGKYVSTDLTKRMLLEGATEMNGNLQNTLSKRERQVMVMISEGKRINEIAAHLNLSDKTVSTYKARVLLKMNFKNTAHLIKYVLDNGIN